MDKNNRQPFSAVPLFIAVDKEISDVRGVPPEAVSLQLPPFQQNIVVPERLRNGRSDTDI